MLGPLRPSLVAGISLGPSGLGGDGAAVVFSRYSSSERSPVRARPDGLSLPRHCRSLDDVVGHDSMTARSAFSPVVRRVLLSSDPTPEGDVLSGLSLLADG